MLNLMNVVTIFGIGLPFDLPETTFWLYVAQAAVVFIGIILFIVLLARTRRIRRRRVVEKVQVVEEQPEKKEKKSKKEKKAEAAVVEETAATAAEQPQVIVVNQPSQEPEKKETIERMLTSISLDVGVVQREFTVGEEFNCDGLLVRAQYNLEPITETIIAYSVVDGEVYDRLSNVNVIKVCYVLRPDLSEEGIKFVTVKYADQTAIYTVSVKKLTPIEKQEEAKPVEKPEKKEKVTTADPTPVEEDEEEPIHETILLGEETVEAGKLRYDRSFMARLIQSEDEVKHWYTEIKNKLLSFKKVKGRISWKRETFKASKDVVAKLAYRGKTLCLFLPLNTADYSDSKYTLEDVSNVPSFVDTPAMIRVKNEKHARQALELIAISMGKLGIKDMPHVSVDYYVPYEGVVELINKGLIKREIKSSQDEAIFVRDKAAPEEQDNDTTTVTEIIVTSKSLDEAEALEDNETPEQLDSPKSKKTKKSK